MALNIERLYFREVNYYKVLDEKTEKILVRRIQKGERRERQETAPVDAERRQAPRRDGDRRAA